MNPFIIGLVVIILITIITVVVVITTTPVVVTPAPAGKTATAQPATAPPAAATSAPSAAPPAAATSAPSAAPPAAATPAATPATPAATPAIVINATTAGSAVRCTGYNPKGDGAIYRYDGNNQMRWYPSPPIAASYDPNWASAQPIDCTGFTLGADVQINPTAAAAPVFRAIKSDAGGRCIDVPGSSKSNINLQMYDCNGTPAQQWMYDSGSKAYKNAFGKCLDVSGGNANPGAIVQQYDCNGTPAQQWSADSQHRIVSGLGNNLCLNIKGGAGNNGDQLLLWGCNENGANEHFNFV